MRWKTSIGMFRQKNVKAIPAIVWTTGKDDYEKLKEIIKC